MQEREGVRSSPPTLPSAGHGLRQPRERWISHEQDAPATLERARDERQEPREERRGRSANQSDPRAVGVHRLRPLVLVKVLFKQLLRDRPIDSDPRAEGPRPKKLPLRGKTLRAATLFFAYVG